MNRRWSRRGCVVLLSALLLMVIAPPQTGSGEPWLPLRTLGGAVEARAQGQEHEMGPYDTAVLPLEDIPEPGDDVYRRPLPLSEEYAQAEVLRVLQDPRTVPIERFLYYKHSTETAREPGWLQEDQRPAFEDRAELLTQVVMHPEADEIVARFEGAPYRAIVVYVRVVGGTYEVETVDSQGTTSVRSVNLTDPFYVKHPTDDYRPTRIDPGSDSSGWRYPPWQPWSQLGVADTESDLTLPCMPQQVTSPGDPYEIPDAGQEFDPHSFLPPEPRYLPEATIGEGVTREGWLLCLAPDVPAEDVELVVQFRDPFTGERSGARSVWKPVDYLQMGAWHLLKDVEVVGWNGPVRRYPRRDFEDDPPDTAQVVYRGPVWVSLAMAMGYRPVDLSDEASRDRYEKVNVAVQMHFEGLEALRQDWDQLALRDPLQAEIFSEELLTEDTRTFGADDVNVWSEGHWVSVERIASKPDLLWASLTGLRAGVVEWGINREWQGATPVWRLEVMDTGNRVSSTNEVCEHTECVDLNRDVYDAAGELDFRGPNVFDGGVPVVGPDTLAHGVLMTQAHLLDEVFRETAGVSLIRSGPQGRDKLILIEGESINGDPYEFDLYCDINGRLTLAGEADPRALHGDLAGVSAVIDGIFSRTRKSTEGMVFYGDVDTLCPLDEMLVLMKGTGPVWSLK